MINGEIIVQEDEMKKKKTTQTKSKWLSNKRSWNLRLKCIFGILRRFPHIKCNQKNVRAVEVRKWILVVGQMYYIKIETMEMLILY